MANPSKLTAPRSPPSPPFDGDPSISLSYPSEHVLLVTINRQKQMNSITSRLHWYLHRVFEWFDQECMLRCAVITGSGTKAFCSGQDLVEATRSHGENRIDETWLNLRPPSGFAGLSQRTGKKPVIAAVNGYAFGGGFEIVLNCDLAVASASAIFCLPEVSRGLYAGDGGLPRLMRSAGLQMASEIAMTGRRLSASEALRYNLINHVSSSEDCVPQAIRLAEEIARLPPDAILVTRAALREAWETASIDRGSGLIDERFRRKLREGENAREGLAAFREKRKPVWKASQL